MSLRGLASRTYVALVHHPVYNRRRRVVTTAVTNLDIHDIARSAKTFGLAGYFVVTPIAAQRTLVQTILDHWDNADPHAEHRAGVAARESPGHGAAEEREGARHGEGSGAEALRSDTGEPEGSELRGWALAQVAVMPSIAETIEAIAGRHDAQRPLLVATSAQPGAGMVTAAALVDEADASPRPMLLLFGTGWGLAQDVLDRVDKRLTPIRGTGNYNHLSVRSATAIVLDRLFGDRAAVPFEVQGAREP